MKLKEFGPRGAGMRPKVYYVDPPMKLKEFGCLVKHMSPHPTLDLPMLSVEWCFQLLAFLVQVKVSTKPDSC